MKDDLARLVAELFKFGRANPAMTLRAELEKFGHQARAQISLILLFTAMNPLAITASTIAFPASAACTDTVCAT